VQRIFRVKDGLEQFAGYLAPIGTPVSSISWSESCPPGQSARQLRLADSRSTGRQSTLIHLGRRLANRQGGPRCGDSLNSRAFWLKDESAWRRAWHQQPGPANRMSQRQKNGDDKQHTPASAPPE